MKKINNFTLWLMMMCLILTFAGCGATDEDADDADAEDTSNESDETETPSLITTYNWQGTQDGSLLVFEEDDSFRYYQSAEDLTDYYFEGTYEFHVGADAVEEPCQTPYFGFYLEEDGELYLDIANMNSANYHLFIAK